MKRRERVQVDKPSAFYEARYARDRQSIRDLIFGEVYDEYFGQSSWISTADYDRFFRWIDVTPDARVIDIACGGGAPALRLGRLAGCSVLGIDSNVEGIARASELAQESGQAERVRFERHDASLPLPFPDGSFDAVVCVDAVVHLPDRPRILAEWARLLQPGGRLLFTDPVMTGPISNAELAARSPHVYFLLVPSGYDEVLLGEAGFDVLRSEDLTETLAETARRHVAARQAHADELRAVEGDREFEMQNRYRAVAEQLYLERRVSHFAFLARKRHQR